MSEINESIKKQQEYNALCSQKSGYESQVSELESEISILNSKIVQLEKAYKRIDEQKELVKDIKWELNWIKGKCFGEWRGANASYTEDMIKDVLKSEYQNYIDAVDEIEDEINLKILEYKKQVNESEGFLGDIKNLISELCVKIQNFFN